MTVVVVSQRIDHDPQRLETRDALDQRLIKFLVAAECTPIPVPNGLGTTDRDQSIDAQVLYHFLDVVKPDGVVLSGGNNVGEFMSRDVTEEVLLEWAKERKLPLLGICRGMQMIAVWAGTSLQPVQGHIGSRHSIHGEISASVNSYHSYALSSQPQEFIVTARSEDGVIEAIRHVSLPWQGWMWHPEREALFSEDDVLRARDLLHMSGTYSKTPLQPSDRISQALTATLDIPEKMR